MDQNQRSTSSSSASRIHQLHPSRSAIVDLFNLYLGRNSRHSGDDSIRETPNKLQKRITALGFGLPPPNEQFILDFEQLVNQFPDQEHLRAVTESVLIALVVKCCSHAPRAEFILFALRSLHSIEYVNWDTFLPALLSSVSSAESSQGQGNQAANANSLSNMSQSGIITSSAVVANSSNFQPSTPASPLASIHGIGSPAQSASELTPCTTISPIRFPDVSGNGLQSTQRPALRDNAVSSLRQISCKIILIGLELDLKPVTHAGIFSHMMNWLVNWDQRQQVVDESNGVKSWKPDRILHEWLHCCLDVVWLLVDENKCRIPFYELIRSGLQFIESVPDDEALFTLVLEIHRRRDMVAMHMQMLDQHLHCPSFGNPRFMSQASPSTVGEPSANTRYSPITYPSVLGEPLHGEDLALSIQKGSLDWERALRCLRHALRTTPSPDWWRRVLLVAPCYKAANQQVPTPGAIFSSEMVYESLIDRIMELLKLTTSDSQCWQEWLIFSDVFFFLMKSGCMDFLDFVDKLASRVNQEDPQILRSNHVTWLLAQIIRIEIVTNALNTDPKKVETTRKILSFHKEDKSSDPNNVNPRSILLDFISSSQTLRIWSINASIRDYLNPEQLQKGKQIDEWWKQATKGERMVDFMNFDERSIGMFWILSYTMAQPACEAVMNWLTAPGIAELVPGSNVQTNERVTVMRECCPLSMSLLSGLSINACLKLVYQIEESLFVGQVIPSIAMVETYALIQRSSGTGSSILSKPGATLLLLEILNYRLIPLYRADALLFADFFVVKKELKGPSEFTETLNRVAILSLAITIKTRGISEVEHLMFLPSLIEQIMATCQHTWSEKTMRYFPPLIRALWDASGAGNLRGERGFPATGTGMGNLNGDGGRDEEKISYPRGYGYGYGYGDGEKYIYPEGSPWGIPIGIPNRELNGEIFFPRGFPFPQGLDEDGDVDENSSLHGYGFGDEAETTVINQCKQLLSPSADPSYVMTYINHSFPQHRKYLCAGAWMLMHSHPDTINFANLVRASDLMNSSHISEIYLSVYNGCVLREFSPEEVTSNIYQMVDVLLLHTHTELQHGRLLQDILLKASGNLAVFVWKHELFPLDILILALIDRDDDPHALRIVISLLERPEIPQRIKLFCINRGPPEHWLHSGISKRTDLQKALGNHLSWKESFHQNVADDKCVYRRCYEILSIFLIGHDYDGASCRLIFVSYIDGCVSSNEFKRFPPFFDDLTGRLLPVIPLVVYRLIENDATEATDKILAIYSSFLAYHPIRFTFVRDILAYFYGHLSSKIIVRLLKVLDVSKIPFSESFPQHIASSNPAMCPPPDYFATLLLGLVNNVLPSLNSKSKSGSVGDAANNSLRGGHNKTPAPSQSGSTNVSEGQKAFYQCQDPGTYTQLVLETATIELLALPASPPQIVSSLVQIVVHVQPTLIQSGNGLQGTSTAIGSTLPTSPSGGSAESLSTSRSNPSASGINSQLPPEFHAQLYLEVSRIIKECWWLTDGKRSMKELDSAVGYALLDPSWAAQDNTSTPIVSSLFFHCLAHYQGNIVALLHAFFSNLPQEWLEGTHAILKHLRPVTSVAMLRVAFRIMGPLLPRLSFGRSLFTKTLVLLLNVMADVFGRNSQPSTPCEATEIVDLIDFLHHALLYEGQGGPVQTTSKPKPETLTMCAKAIEMLRPDVQHLLFHMQTDPNSSIYAATHPKLGQNPSQ
ncbi:hypothetical protein Scep_022771 [Stephania cephalantha]|uniref:Mediator of RNA polymerase II transcription subunit 23 n=1 Tax=Stephania cephalantha TaxID=152367 RepID=A0AAP0I170_9MAGN